VLRLAPLHIILAAYVSGLVLALAWRPGPLALVLATATAGAVLLHVRRRRSQGPAARVAGVLALAALFVAAGAALGAARLAGIASSQLAARIGASVTLDATLVDLPELREDRLTLPLRVTAVDGAAVDEPAHLALRVAEGERPDLDQTGPLTEGARVRVGPVRVEGLPPPPADGGFDYGRYLRRRGEHVLLEGDFARLELAGRRGGLTGLVDRLRLASRAHLAAGLRSPVREVLQGMVLGDDERLDPALIDAFRRSGLLHIMAVSGENVVLLCSMWGFALTLFGVPRRLRLLVLIPIVLLYVVLTGAAPSIMRAGFAGVIGLLATLVSRPSDGWLLWLAPGAVLLTVNPATLFDVSFQLSFAAVAGLLLLARPLTRLLSFLPGPLPEQAGVTTAASLSTAPVSLLTFGSTSLVAVPANVAGGFVLGLVMFLGMLSLLLGFVHPWVGLPLNLVSGVLLGFLCEVAQWFARPDWAVYEWRGVTLTFTLLAALAAEAAVVALLARRAGCGFVAYLGSRGRRLALATATAAVCAAAIMAAPAPAAAPSEARLTILDVGEGAAALLQVPGGPTVLIDAGPEPLERALREHGVERIDLLVLSHGHADHVAGLDDVLGRLPVAAALLPGAPGADAALDRLQTELVAAGVRSSRCLAPALLSGPGWRLTVLPTSSGESGDANQAENDLALVVVAELGTTAALLPGDAEAGALSTLDLPEVDIVELPHHGSRDGVDGELLDRLRPRLAVVSVGPNRFGHPAAEMMALLDERGLPLLRTDRHGDVAVGPGEDEASLPVWTAGG
jgi:competence protein ComEC